MPDAYTYLYLDLFTIAGPLLLSFDKKVSFYKDWKHLFPSLFIVSGLYLIWDVWFTHQGIWEFNYQYLLGLKIGNLPIEEYGFFLVVPYACLFIYRCLQAYFPKIKLPFKSLYYVLAIASLIVAVSSWGKLYTTVTFGLIGVSMVAIRFSTLWDMIQQHFTHLFLAWIISAIPMLYVNGKLTGLPVLIYNNSENLFIRVGTIPIEDFFYNFLYIFWMVLIVEYRKNQRLNVSN